MRQNYRPGEYQRGGNTKTHGIVRGEFIVRDDVPAHMRHGVFAKPHTYRAWVRFSGPGPDMPKDIEDVGFVSCAIKLMGVPEPKILDDEKFTQDFISVCTPTFVTPDINANALLQAHVLRGTPVFYFFTTGVLAFSRFSDAGSVERDADQPARSALLELRPLSAGARPGDDVFGAAKGEDAQPDRQSAVRDAVRQLPARGDDQDVVGNGCRI